MTIATKEAVQQEQYLTFLLAGEEYAIGILKVKEIIEYDTVTTVPKTPRWVRGVINLRGTVVPVLELGLKFGLEERPVTKTTCIVIVEGQVGGQSSLMGVLADAVSQVMEIAAEDIREVPAFGTRIKVDYLQGMAQLGKKFVLLLDIDKVLSADEAQDLSAATTNLEDGDSGSAAPDLAEAALSQEKHNSPADTNRQSPHQE
jgi:purine-binding chemotaxis protein CheW